MGKQKEVNNWRYMPNFKTLYYTVLLFLVLCYIYNSIGKKTESANNQRVLLFYALTIQVKQGYNHSITDTLVFSNI